MIAALSITVALYISMRAVLILKDTKGIGGLILIPLAILTILAALLTVALSLGGPNHAG